MRAAILILLCLTSLSSFAQIPTNLWDWFYGINLTSKVEKIKNAIDTDNRFIRYPDSDTIGYSFTRNRTFYGKIISPFIDSFDIETLNIDSAIIELTFGIISNTGSKNPYKAYSGWTKILNTEFF
jgi:hypothetical protein